MSGIAESFDKKDDVSLGRFLKEVENNSERSVEILKHSYVRRGNAHLVGVTGPPGAGKSTLVSKMVKGLSKQEISVGVVCIDPTSPFTNGALMGDRIRMLELASIPNVFIKSLATRGNLGGLAASTADIVSVMNAYGKDVIIIETVGVGQVEFDVMEVADTVVLVNVPGLGDSLQTYKGGIMEVADIFVINQADRPGANDSIRDLKMMIRESGEAAWKRPVVKTIATEEVGVDRLVKKITEHKTYLLESGLWKKKREERNIAKINHVILDKLNSLTNVLLHSEEFHEKVEKVRNGELDPITVSEDIISSVLKKNHSLEV